MNESTSTLMKTIFINKVVADYVDVCKNLQIQRTIACNDSLELVVRAQAKANVFVLTHLQERYELEVLKQSPEALTTPNQF